jgi:hypothetical protein
MRIGVVVFVRVAGRIVHRLELAARGVRRHVLEVAVMNRGNVAERRRVRMSLSSKGHLLARRVSARRTWLPHSRGIVRFRYAGRLPRWVTARVEVGALRRTLRIRL